MINGRSGAITAGNNPPANAIKLGTKQRIRAKRIPTINRVIIKIALIIGPLSHCWCKKNGTSIDALARPRNLVIIWELTLEMAFSFKVCIATNYYYAL